MIQISHGTATLRPMTRKLKKAITRLMFSGQGMDMESGQMEKVPLENLVMIAEGAFHILCEKITIDGTDHTPATPDECAVLLEKLEAAGTFTDEDYDACEEAAVTLWKGKDVKKNLPKSDPSS